MGRESDGTNAMSAYRAQRDLLKVVVQVPASEWHEELEESMWAAHVGEARYELRNIPTHSRNLSFGDLVEAIEGPIGLLVTRVVRKSGHSTYRIFLEASSAGDVFAEEWQAFDDQGCSYESSGGRLYAVDVPPTADIFEVYERLERGEARGLWDFEEGDCGHPDLPTST